MQRKISPSREIDACNCAQSKEEAVDFSGSHQSTRLAGAQNLQLLKEDEQKEREIGRMATCSRRHPQTVRKLRLPANAATRAAKLIGVDNKNERQRRAAD